MRSEISVVGTAALNVESEIPGPLDELIYRACSSALADAEMPLSDVDGVCMAASDVMDGRGISTMTLTGSTGSLRKSELRICNDGLAAVGMAVAELLSGAHERILVCAWSKLSDTDPSAIAPLSLEPAFHRPLGLHPDVIYQLRESHSRKSVTITQESDTRPADTAVAAVLARGRHGSDRAPATVLGFGSTMGNYLGPTDGVTDSLVAAADRALANAGTSPERIAAIHVGGMHQLDNERVQSVLGISRPVFRGEPERAEIGYAAGLLAFTKAVEQGEKGLALVVSANGVGLQSANALVVEVA